MKKRIDSEEINWDAEFGVWAINRGSRLVENCSAVPGITVEIFEGKDESEVSDLLLKRLFDGFEYEYALYDREMFLVGFAYFE